LPPNTERTQKPALSPFFRNSDPARTKADETAERTRKGIYARLLAQLLRKEVGRVGFEQDPVHRDLADDLLKNKVVVSVADHRREADHEAGVLVEPLAALFPARVKAVLKFF